MKIIKTMVSIAAIAAMATSLSACYVKFNDKARAELKKSFSKVVYGEMDSVVYRPGEFSRLQCQGPVDVHFIPTDLDPRVVVTSSTNLLDSVKVRNLDGLLEISLDVMKHGDEKAYVYYPCVTGFTGLGSGDLRVEGGFGVDSLAIESMGSGDFGMDGVIEADVCSITKVGSGDVSASFRARIASVSGQGSGDIRMSISGADSLKVDIAGSGDLRLKGEAHVADFCKQGSGDIDASELRNSVLILSGNGGSGKITYPKAVRASE